MPDPRVQKLARILVRYSLGVQRGQSVSVQGGTAAEPLILAVYEELLRVGAHPFVRMQPDGLQACFFQTGRPHHFTEASPVERACAKAIDASIRIYSQTNTRELSSVDPRRQTAYARAMDPVMRIIRRKPWTLTLFPTAAYAQDADMSLREFEDFVYAATFADEARPVAAWRALHRDQQRLIQRLEGADEVHITGPGTDLKLSVRDRVFINSDGHRNMPSGEIFTGPVETSAEGCIQYDFPVCHLGREIEGIRLVFRSGKVVEATAAKNEAFLREMLAMDAGATRLGELGIGTNRRIQRFTRNILFDEKIGGTVHLALGQSYAETGGRNRSSLHWDMIKDLRQGGAVHVDGKLFQEDGRFV